MMYDDVYHRFDTAQASILDGSKRVKHRHTPIEATGSWKGLGILSFHVILMGSI